MDILHLPRVDPGFACQIVDVVPHGLTVTSSEERYEYANPTCATLVGRVPAELIGSPPLQITDPAGHPAIHAAALARYRAKAADRNPVSL